MGSLDDKVWLITGGCGFIGTALIKRTLEDQPKTAIRVLDNLSVGTMKDLENITGGKSSEECGQFAERVELLVGDIRDAGNCLRAAKGMDVIVHLAANTGVGPSVEDPVADMESNVRGTLNMLEAARQNGVHRFIFASSGAPVGEVEPPIHEELAPHPVSPYGASKLAGEGYCSAYFRSFGVATVALRFGNVYGPGSRHKTSLVAKFIRQAIQSESCEIYGDGTQTRDFIYIEDLIEAIILSTYQNVAGELFQIATNEEHAVTEVAETIRSILSTDHNISMDIEHGTPRVGDVRRNFSDTSKALNQLGWQAKTDFEEGIRKTIEWFIRDQATSV